MRHNRSDFQKIYWSNINRQKTILKSISLGLIFLSGGCAIQAPPIAQKEASQSIATQRAAQQAVASQAPAVPTLKRKIALGRISNETNYGRSLLRDRFDDPLGKQVTDLMSKALTESGAYMVFERPDLNRVIAESQISSTKLNLIGVDALIVGSLTEFGRKTVGETGFVSSSKRQVAFAKVDIRLVDTSNGHVFFAASPERKVLPPNSRKCSWPLKIHRASGSKTSRCWIFSSRRSPNSIPSPISDDISSPGCGRGRKNSGNSCWQKVSTGKK